MTMSVKVKYNHFSLKKKKKNLALLSLVHDLYMKFFDQIS